MLNRSAAFKTNGTIYLYEKKSLSIFRGDLKCRQLLVRLIHSKFYEYFNLTVILLNSISIACYDLADPNSLTLKNQVLNYIELGFTGVFALDVILKIIGQGLVVHKNSYLKSVFGILDLIVVGHGILEFYVQNKWIRLFRVLRPFKSVYAIEKLKKLVVEIVKALPGIANVGLFLIFGIIVTSILGVNQYSGQFYNMCSIPDQGMALDEGDLRPCSLNGLGFYQCSSGAVCGDPAIFNLTSSDPIYLNTQSVFDISNFDHLGSAILSIFLLFTHDGWNFYMYNLMDMDVPAIAIVYCIFLRIFFMFFLFNQLLAVIIEAFIHIHKKELHQLLNLTNSLDKSTKKYLSELSEIQVKKASMRSRKTLLIKPEFKMISSTSLSGDPFEFQRSKVAQIKEEIERGGLSGKQINKIVEELDGLLERIQDLKGSFDDPYEALKFSKPHIRKRIFTRVFASIFNQVAIEEQIEKIEKQKTMQRQISQMTRKKTPAGFSDEEESKETLREDLNVARNEQLIQEEMIRFHIQTDQDDDLNEGNEQINNVKTPQVASKPLQSPKFLKVDQRQKMNLKPLIIDYLDPTPKHSIKSPMMIRQTTAKSPMRRKQTTSNIENEEEYDDFDEKQISKQNIIKRVMMSLIERAIEKQIQFDQRGIPNEAQKIILSKIDSQKKHLTVLTEQLSVQAKKESMMRMQINRFRGKGGDIRELAQQNQTDQLKDRLGKINAAKDIQFYIEKRQRNPCFRMAHFIVKSFLFKMLVVICIGANIVIIGMDRYPASIIDSIYLEKVNIFFTAVQLIEMVLMQRPLQHI